MPQARLNNSLILSTISAMLVALVPGCDSYPERDEGGERFLFLETMTQSRVLSLPSAVESSEEDSPVDFSLVMGQAQFRTTKIGSPQWEPVDFQQYAVSLADKDPFLSVLSPPNHVYKAPLGISPGEAHAPPYDHEISEGVEANRFATGKIFDSDDMTYPNGIFQMWMVVPSSGAPAGSSPDFDRGPIIPHTIFPIRADIALHMSKLAGGGEPYFEHFFEVVALDTLEEPFLVDGHSHFPIISGMYSGIQFTVGLHSWKWQLLDTQGNGWKVEYDLVVRP